MHKKILILADIEGSSGCLSYRHSSFMTHEWSRACIEMSHDLNAVVAALFGAGVDEITIKDFHRTGYNILRHLVDKRARIVYGYHEGPVAGIGDPGDATGLMMIGLHAASGTGGFLAHTLTSRLARIEVNGQWCAECELFASSLESYGLQPIFFSGCPVACSQAVERMPGIAFTTIDKSHHPDFDFASWRQELACAAVKSLTLDVPPYRLHGPFDVAVTMRDGPDIASKLARRWKLDHTNDILYFRSNDFDALYFQLIKLCYLNSITSRMLPVSLCLFNLMGRLGYQWLRFT